MPPNTPKRLPCPNVRPPWPIAKWLKLENCSAIATLAVVSLPRSLAFHALDDAAAGLLIDVAPIFERAFQYGPGHAVFQVPHHV